jgi:ATP-dependent Clp protease ATP-binding subunit ClpA
VLTAAQQLRDTSETHVGVHHLLLALLSEPKSPAAPLLRTQGLTLAKARAAVAAIRQNRPTGKDEGEGEFDNLRKYGEWRVGREGGA